MMDDGEMGPFEDANRAYRLAVHSNLRQSRRIIAREHRSRS
jgi:hypothetical protein